MPINNAIKNIAVLNFGGLGDNILFLPIINSLCELHPDAQITWITETRSGGIQDLLPDQVTVEFISIQQESRLKLFFKLRLLLIAKKYDTVISSGSSPFIAVMLASTGIPTRVGYNTGMVSQLLLTQAAPLDLTIYASEMHYKLIEAYINIPSPLGGGLGWGGAFTERVQITPTIPKAVLAKLPTSELPDANYIAIHPGVSLASIQKNILKGWSVENWCELTRQLLEQYPQHKILLLGGPDDEAIITAIQKQLSERDLNRIENYAGKTDTVAKLASILRQIKVLICVDSAPMHLAVALGTPVVPLFAPTDPFKLLPKAIAEQTVRRIDLACQPCMFDKRKTSCDNPVCLDISVDSVLQHVRNRLH